jgi:hypothetical protein
MSMLRHPNCTLYLGVCLEPPCLLMEYCSRRSVDAILRAAHTDAKASPRFTLLAGRPPRGTHWARQVPAWLPLRASGLQQNAG